jgi:hypothetical protein
MIKFNIFLSSPFDVSYGRIKYGYDEKVISLIIVSSIVRWRETTEKSADFTKVC